MEKNVIEYQLGENIVGIKTTTFHRRFEFYIKNSFNKKSTTKRWWTTLTPAIKHFNNAVKALNKGTIIR